MGRGYRLSSLAFLRYLLIFPYSDPECLRLANAFHNFDESFRTDDYSSTDLMGSIGCLE